MGLGPNPAVAGCGPRAPVSVCALLEAAAGSRVRGGGPARARLPGHVREPACEYVRGLGAPRVCPSVHAQICGRTGTTAYTRIRVLTPRPSGRRRGRKWSRRSGCRWACWLRAPSFRRGLQLLRLCPLCPLSSCPGYAHSLKHPRGTASPVSFISVHLGPHCPLPALGPSVSLGCRRSLEVRGWEGL